MSVPVNALTGLRSSWITAFVYGELVGFAAHVVTGATLAGMGAPDVVLVAALTTAGCFEGLAIGPAASARSVRAGS